jgi:hypothetical protein
MVTLNFNCFLKGPISKYSHMGLEFQHMNLGDTIQSIALPQKKHLSSRITILLVWQRYLLGLSPLLNFHF